MITENEIEHYEQPEMAFYLTETEKILIIAFAASLFLLSVLLTVCFVSPFCALNKWFTKVTNKVNHAKLNEKHIFKPESKHFRLSIAPHYGTSVETVNAHSTSKKCSNNERKDGVKHKKLLNKHKSSSVSSNDSDLRMAKLETQIQFGIEWLMIDENSVRLHIHIVNVIEIPLRGYGSEPCCFICVDLISIGGLRNKRRNTSSLLTKAAISFKTAIAKRGLQATFNETFTTSELPKSVLKEGRLKIRLMDDERYANPYCIGEINVPLKKYLQSGEKNEIIESYNFLSPKECKGEILFGICYLPTSKRVTINIMKAALTGQSPGSNLNYYIRILMFVNGKLIRKKKTPSSQKLTWSEQETITFDLSNSLPNEITFMLALSSSKEPIINVTSLPSSPEEPSEAQQQQTGSASSDSKRLRHLGHCIVGENIWREMKDEPRKQLSYWLKLM